MVNRKKNNFIIEFFIESLFLGDARGVAYMVYNEDEG